MEKENHDTNRHHLIPSSKWGLTTPRNIIDLDIREHTRRHSWCGNDTPVEAICRVLLMNEKVFTENFKQDLMDTLDRYMNNYYEKKTHRWFIKSEVEKVLGTEDDLFGK